MYQIKWDDYLSSERDRVSEADSLRSESDKRNEFESDFGRVCFSTAARRLHDKTQVIPLSSSDSVHSRLTHSIEVMNVAYSLGISYCRNPEFIDLYKEKASEYTQCISAILRTAAFVHDIGNPPFGHFGEQVIQEYFVKLQKKGKCIGLSNNQLNDFIYFDGNAEGFRTLTKLNYMGDLSGLNLTFATLAAYCKYPNFGAPNNSYIGCKKHGIFESEKLVFEKMAKACNMIMPGGKYKRYPLSFFVEAADSICYNVMDIEDGFYQGWYTVDDIIDHLRQLKCGKIKDIIKQDADLCGQYTKGEILDRKRMMMIRVQLISYLVNIANKNFENHLEDIDLGRYNKELVEDDDYGVTITLRDFAIKRIFPRKEILQMEMVGQSVITGLLDVFLDYCQNNDKKYRQKLNGIISSSNIYVARHEKYGYQNKFLFDEDAKRITFDIGDYDLYTKLGIFVDQISGMTDRYAVSLYQKLSGVRL